MNAAIIGTGFLGEQIYKDILPICDEILLTHHKNKKYPDSKEFDFFKDDIGNILNGKKIDTIFLSAKIEFEEDEKKLAESMTRFLESCKDMRIIYISSDGIFDGESGSYKESDIPHPKTLYGKNLEICEKLVKKYADNYCIVRPSYMFGFVDSNLDSRFRKVSKDAAEGKKIARFTDMYKSPLSYQQASEAIVKLASSEYNGVVHVCGERMSVYDFTKEGMEALGLSTEDLTGEPMPKEKPVDFLPDTSLDNSLMREITGIKPLSVKEGLESSMPKMIDTNALPKKYFR